MIASGFNRLFLIIDRGTALPEEIFTRNVIDRVTAVGTAFMGLTVQCAVCHDHQYDAITMHDSYGLFAIFNDLDSEPETGGRQGTDFQGGLLPPYISLPSDAQTARPAEFSARIEKLNAAIQKLERRAKDAVEDAQKETLEAELDQAKKALKSAQDERQAFDATIPVTMVMKEKVDPRPAHMLIRGAYDNLRVTICWRVAW